MKDQTVNLKRHDSDIKDRTVDLEGHDSNRIRNAMSKVPAVTAAFWLVKILATTLGETGGDAVSMSMKLGYLVSTAIFCGYLHCCGDGTNIRSEI
jgi:uncharacterized membrane-anchored protein